MTSYREFSELVEEIEALDPIDMTGLAVPLDGYKDLVCNNVWEMHQTIWKALPTDERETAMMAALAKLILDNFIMHVRIKLAFSEDK